MRLPENPSREARISWYVGYAVLGLLATRVAAWFGPAALQAFGSASLVVCFVVSLAAFFLNVSQGLSLATSTMRASDCTRCGRGRIARVRATADGYRFYRCASCGARYVRRSTYGRKLDASSSQYDGFFLPPGPRPRQHIPRAKSGVADVHDWTRTVDHLFTIRQIKHRAREAENERKKLAPRTFKGISPSFQVRRDTDGLWDRDLDG